MKGVKVYVTLKEFSDYVKSKIPQEDLKDLEDCIFVPVKIELANDFTIEALCIAAKDGITINDNVRYNITNGSKKYE